MKKYGIENFTCTPIDWAYSKEELNEKEIWWIAYFRTLSPYEGYNIADGGNFGLHRDMFGENNPMWGKQHTEETRRKISNTRIERGIGRGKDNYWYSHPLPEEAKQKMREAHLGTHLSEEHKNKIRAGNLGKKVSKETKRKSSLANSKFTEKQILEIVELKKQGFSLTDLAKRFDVTPSTISNICNGKRYSLITGIQPKKKMNRPKFTENQILEIIALREQGLLLKEIAQKFSVSEKTISRICKGITWSKVTGLGK